MKSISIRIVSMHCSAAPRAMLMLLLVAEAGCAEVAKKMQPTWHEQFHWKAEEYFDDPHVIALCRAIESNDIAEIDRLVAAGSDVNAQGKGKMTPLLWAFPDNKLPRFKRLLEHGANPNVVIESDFNTRGGMRAGDSITHMACKTAFPGYFDAVFAHGGEVNLQRTSLIGLNDTPLYSVIKGSAPDKGQKVQTLIKLGADLNHINGAGMTPVRQAVSWGGQYHIALQLLKAGADFRISQPNENSRLIHRVIEEENRLPYSTPQQKKDHQTLLQWLVNNGESISKARQDIQRWKSWSQTTGEYRRKMDAEIAARKTKEAQKRESAKADDSESK